jgi:quercetin dioxygenase-like cupin family protein
MAETLRLTPGETVIIRKSSPELLEVEGAWAPEGKPPPPHFHPSQEEHFEVLEGTLTARVEGEKGDLGPGDRLDIPRGAKHQMWNRTGSPAGAVADAASRPDGVLVPLDRRPPPRGARGQ